ncbi:PREDICTED: alpha N-terminal protein methyltransferase 1 [Rhagoletis zephyria]|uniref:alpha N-terminal protein methyltransferase 1 n=1 Tax=Rhagoletis zephyria TaxID=28612 RepID=UPI0008117FBE|nr:PREDICTED: alpha N-terminal protein methyltransferase 1 [Rhagoletis zephyria]XP_036334351.1 alpha N-terminal protein methyltransferase 1 [Rhagoletis pomonella]
MSLTSEDTMSTTHPGQQTENDFYGRAQKYWSEVPATVNGMLGGLGYLNRIDIQGSSSFLRELKDLDRNTALDCGAGIGRITKNLLLPRFETTDIVEQNASFTEKAREFCTENNEHLGRLGEIYTMGLQEFTPTAGKYDVIWCQWVLGHLTENDLLNFFRRIRSGLSTKGYLIVKENVTSSSMVEEDKQDSSVTRPLKAYETAIRSGGFRIVKSWRQQSFPPGLYPVYMLACRPTE